MLQYRTRSSLSSLFNLLSRHLSRKSGEETALIDYLEVQVQGGKGGYGCASLQHLVKNKIKPDGGDGGVGGSIYFKPCKNTADFSHIPKKIIGKEGHRGSGSNRRGERGKDTVISVPAGTIIGCLQSQSVITELKTEDDVFQAAPGGQGGRGNQTISGSMEMGHARYHCREKDDGKEGELIELYLEMRIIADVGLVGLPNAGKSSLLRAISAAKPKVAAYPFTTMRPHVGVIHFENYHRVQMADVPGLIEGSSLGHGLGFSFLRHIERCKSILYVVDMTNSDKDPVSTITILEKELEAYKAGMTEGIVGIVANKIDLLSGPEPLIDLARAFPKYPVIPISALEQRNVVGVRQVLEPYKTLFVHNKQAIQDLNYN